MYVKNSKSLKFSIDLKYSKVFFRILGFLWQDNQMLMYTMPGLFWTFKINRHGEIKP